MQSLSSYVNEQLEPNLIITFCSDIMQHEKQLESEALRGYTYSGVFDDVEPYLKSSNFVIGNLETTLGDDKNDGFPKFSAPKEILGALKRAGFDALITCNNHSNDKGDLGIQQTYTRVLEAGMTPVGTCETKLITVSDNGIQVTIHVATDISNVKVRQKEQTKLLTFYNVDNFVPKEGLNIAHIHCGEEYNSNPTDRQLEIEKELMSKGFDAVIFIHSHVIAQTKFSEGKFVSYGSGNFLSDQENLDRQLGQIIQLNCTKDRIRSYQLINTETIWDNNLSKIIII